MDDAGQISWCKGLRSRRDPDRYYAADDEPDERQHPLDGDDTDGDR